MSAPGTHTQLSIARGKLERALDAYHNAAYLNAIGHWQAPSPDDLEHRRVQLDDAYREYLRRIERALGAAQLPP